jgi:F-type H+-transporting ATPase subunit a
MIAATLVTVALSLSLAQHPGAAEAQLPPGHPPIQAAPTETQAAPAAAPAAPGDAHAAGAVAPEHGAAAEHGAPAGGEHGAAGEHAAAGEHGAAAGGHGGGHDTSLGAVMMHHVANGYLIEYPGVCHGGFAWNCEIDLKEVFGDKLVFGSVDMTPTKHLVMMWIASVLLLIVVFGALAKKSLVPQGLYNFVEMLVQFVRNEIAVKNIGERDADRFVPYLLTAFFFILFVNLLGLVPYAATATANVNVTVMLALFTFLITQFAAIKAMGIGGFLAHLTGGVPKSLAPLWIIMIPVEFLGLFTKPFALTVRLFANMVAGHFVILALLGLIFAISVWVFPVSIGLALGIFLLELFVAFVQAYIFTMLSALFIGAGLVHHGDDHGHGDEHGHAGPGMGSEHHASHVAGTSPGHG